MLEQLLQYAIKIAGVGLVFFLGFKVAGLAGKLTEAALRRGRVDETLTRFGARAARWLILVLVIIACLGAFGIETTSFAAIIGAAGLAIGLAFQGTLSNVAAGIMLLIFRPFKVGDLIRVSGELGTVVEIGLFTTAIDTLDNRRVILPNSGVFGTTIENITHNPKLRVDIPVGIDYRASIAETRAVLQRAAATVPGSIDTPQIILLALGGSSVDWEVRVWCHTADYWTVWDATIEAVKTALDTAQISIPYPQLDVHLDRAS